jgi:hypothetical protein
MTYEYIDYDDLDAVRHLRSLAICIPYNRRIRLA